MTPLDLWEYNKYIFRERKKMEKADVLGLWVDVLYEGKEYTPEQEAKALEVLNAVYEVGFEAGRDALKLEKQLGKPKTPKPEV